VRRELGSLHDLTLNFKRTIAEFSTRSILAPLYSRLVESTTFALARVDTDGFDAPLCYQRDSHSSKGTWSTALHRGEQDRFPRGTRTVTGWLCDLASLKKHGWDVRTSVHRLLSLANPLPEGQYFDHDTMVNHIYHTSSPAFPADVTNCLARCLHGQKAGLPGLGTRIAGCRRDHVAPTGHYEVFRRRRSGGSDGWWRRCSESDPA
jgi:hypothetical protein